MSRREYWCFISYRHLDNRQEGRQWATWLHQALETYEVPDSLVGTRNERGETIPERLFPVFRDEEELATGDLTQRIYEALDRSRTLVVICSARATQSAHVDAEIRYFKSLDREAAASRIHACIVEGDPNGDAHSGRNCFPEALRYEVAGGTLLRDRPVTPLGADFRLADGGQGWTTPEAYRRGLVEEAGAEPGHDIEQDIEQRVAAYRDTLKTSLLRLISGILGVPYGTLRARDKAYQLKLAQARARTLRRWLTAVSALAVLVIAIGGFTYIQSKQMRRADRVASARQTLDLARVLNDEDPLAALKHALSALSVLEKDDPANLEDTYGRMAEVVRSGRLARIGKNVRSVFPMADGKRLFVAHADDVGELIGTSDLASIVSRSDVREVSDPWGPDSRWRTLNAHSVLDTRDGTLGFQKMTGITGFKPPPDIDHWQPFARFSNRGGLCSPAFAECFVMSVDDYAEWAAVDSYVERLDFESGEVSQVEDIYELTESPQTAIPCRVTREDGGWYLATAQRRIHLTGNYDHELESFAFSPKGAYALVRRSGSVDVYSCETGDVRFTRKHGKTSVRAAFSADDDLLMLLTGPRAEIISTADFQVAARPAGDFTDVSAVQELAGTPASWKLSTGSGPEIVVYTKHGLRRGLDTLDRGGRLGALKGRKGAFLDLSTGKSLSIPAVGHAFSAKPDADFFATFHEVPDRRAGKPGEIDRIVLRDIRDPGRSLRQIDRPDPELGRSALELGQFGEFVYAAAYADDTTADPPFITTYTHATELFDAQSAKPVATVSFLVRSCSSSPDRAGALTICRGSTHERDDLHVVLSSLKRSVLWVADGGGDRVERVFSGDSENPQFFLVGFRSAPGELYRTTDGRKIATLSAAIARAQFLPDGRHLVAWYKDGRSELWALHAEDAVRLAMLGLIVSEVHVVSGTTQLVVRHDDGRAYWIDTAWLSAIAGQPVEQVVRQIREQHAGPASSAWWQAGHPQHYPWKALEPPPIEEGASDSADEPEWEDSSDPS